MNGGVNTLKTIDFSKSVFELCSEDPQVIEIMKELGFDQVTNIASLNTMSIFENSKPHVQLEYRLLGLEISPSYIVLFGILFQHQPSTSAVFKLNGIKWFSKIHTVGRFITIPKSAVMKGIELETIKDEFSKRGYDIKE